MIRKRIMLIMLIMVFILCGCGIFYSPGIEGEKLSQKLLDALSSRDEEKLKNLFCTKLSDESGFDNEMKELMDFIDGKIISNNSLTGTSGGDSEARDGKYVKLSVNPRIKNIKTDTGKVYSIKYTAYLIWEDNEDKIGITELCIVAEDGTEYVMD